MMVGTRNEVVSITAIRLSIFANAFNFISDQQRWLSEMFTHQTIVYVQHDIICSRFRTTRDGEIEREREMDRSIVCGLRVEYASKRIISRLKQLR